MTMSNSSTSGGLTAFWYKIGHWRKNLLSVTIVIIDSDKALGNQRNEGIRFKQWTLNTRGITKCLYLNL